MSDKYTAGKGNTYGRVIKNGHTMTMYDVLMDLNRIESLEKAYKTNLETLQKMNKVNGEILTNIVVLEDRLSIANESIKNGDGMNEYRRQLNIYLARERRRDAGVL